MQYIEPFATVSSALFNHSCEHIRQHQTAPGTIPPTTADTNQDVPDTVGSLTGVLYQKHLLSMEFKD